MLCIIHEVKKLRLWWCRVNFLSTSDLARNGHPSFHKHKAIAVLRAYFDETGHVANTKSVTLCGLVASPDEWDAFDISWREQLSVERVSYFHAHECEVGKGEEYSKLSRPLRESLFWGLGDVIGNSTIKIVNGALRVDDWNNPDFEVVRKAFKSPWHLSFAYCLQQLSDWSHEHANDEPIALVFSEQDEYQKHAEVIYQAYLQRKSKNNLVSLQFAPMKLFPGLQAADYVCYETYQNDLFGIKEEKDVKRIAMKRLLQGKATKFSSPFSPELWKGWVSENA